MLQIEREEFKRIKATDMEVLTLKFLNVDVTLKKDARIFKFSVKFSIKFNLNSIACSSKPKLRYDTDAH